MEPDGTFTFRCPPMHSFNLPSQREDAYKHFRFTPRTTIVSLMGFVFVPGAIYYLSTQTTNKWSWAGKRKDQALTKESS